MYSRTLSEITGAEVYLKFENLQFTASFKERGALNGSAATFGLSTIAEGIAVKEPGKMTQEIIRKLVTDIVLVDEGDIEEAIVMLLEIEKTVVEVQVRHRWQP